MESYGERSQGDRNHARNRYIVALAGNPNCGKTSIFNALTGSRQHVGNYPGVTVDSKSGDFELDGCSIHLIDLPGVYSLSSSSPEEEVVFEELMKPGIDLIVNVIDSTIPQRSMYLTTQLAELHIPMLLALNMSDDAKEKGLNYDIPKLEKYFGSPIVRTVGSHISGVRPLLERLSSYLDELDEHGVPMLSYGQDLDDSLAVISRAIDDLKVSKYAHIPSRFFAIKLLEHDTCVMRIREFQPVQAVADGEIRHLIDCHAIETETFMADRRYAMLAGACRDAIKLSRERRREISDRIDLVMTNKLLGLPLFLLIMYLTFLFTFSCAAPFMGVIENFFAWLSAFIARLWNPEFLPWVRSLVTDGIISGVGGVLVFLPNILFLFFAIAILEDSGYMSRAAFVMDGLMRKFGLQGRSFVPLVLGFGCNVPAIMATRCIENDRDRKVTIMVLPLMSCGARLPIYSLLIPVFFPKMQSVMMWLIYVLGIIMALGGALLMRRTLFKGDGEVYLMELPPYRMPTFRSLFLHMWDHSKEYLHKAGTIILLASVILFTCNTWPVKKQFSVDYDGKIAELDQERGETVEQMERLLGTEFEDGHYPSAADLKNLEAGAPEAQAFSEYLLELKRREAAISRQENLKKAEMLEYTVSGRVGHFLEPLFRPLGFDWRLVTASLGALAAKEIFVSQLGILFASGGEAEPLRATLAETYSPLQALCIMIFCLLTVPCLATLAVIRRELNSWKMMFCTACGLLLVAWITATVVFQIGTFCGF